MLRPYQQAAVDSVYHYLRTNPGKNPCVVLPTGSGKTHVIKQIVGDSVDKWGGRVMVLAHVKELLEQAAEKLDRPDVGIYSAGLKSRQKHKPITIAGIQSVYGIAEKFEPFDLILVDEAHLIPPKGDGMYQQFLQTMLVMNPRCRLVGLTATPYRLTSGMICGDDNLLHSVCYNASVRDLIDQGYLCKLRSKQGSRELDLSGVHRRGGEFVAAELEAAVDADNVVESAVSEIKRHTHDRKSVLIFATSVRHAFHLQCLLPEAEIIVAETVSAERSEAIAKFRAGELKYLINVNVLSTGFDAPNVDAIAMLRPTLSPGMYYQQVGRGLRLHHDKDDCLVLDFAGNVKRHGPIDDITAPTERRGTEGIKHCPNCRELVKLSARECGDCGYIWPEPQSGLYQPKHNPIADNAPILAVSEPPESHIVKSVSYAVHYKKDASADAPRTLRVDYVVGLGERISEWVCVEHEGFAGKKARGWWSARSHDPFPDDADHAVAIANAGGLAETLEITTKRDGKYQRITNYKLSEAPDPTFIVAGDDGDDEEW